MIIPDFSFILPYLSSGNRLVLKVYVVGLKPKGKLLGFSPGVR